METPQRKTRKSNGLLSIYILTFLCIVSCAISVFFYFEINSLKNESIVLNTNINNLSNELELKNNTINEISNEINDLDNIQNKIDEIKDEYFSLVVKAEKDAKDGAAPFKVCFLTFDDGPYRSTTPGLLDILDDNDVLATFFLLGKEDLDDIYKREKTSCHTLANHTYSHNIKYIYSSEDIFIEDVLKNREFLENLLGYRTNIMRFPGGSPQANYSGLDRESIASKLAEHGYGYIDWTVSSGDGKGNGTSEEYLHNVIDNSSKFNVMSILMHDYSENTIAILDEMIDTLSSQGFIFLPLTYDCQIIKKK